MVHRGVFLCLIIVALVIMTGASSQRYVSAQDYYVRNVDYLVDSLKSEAGVERYSLENYEMYTNIHHMVPQNGTENLDKLVAFTKDRFSLWNPDSDKPLRIYFVDYETYRIYGSRFTQITKNAWQQNQPPIESSLGFFIPLTTGEFTYIIYSWSWFVHLHEMFHIAMTSHVSFLTGTNHGAIDPEVGNAWVSDKVQGIVDAATKGEVKS